MKKAETALLILISIAAISINLTTFPVEAQTTNETSAPTNSPNYLPPIGISILSPMNNQTLTTNTVVLRFTINEPTNATYVNRPVSVNMVLYFLDGKQLGIIWTHHVFSEPFSVNIEVPDGKHQLEVAPYYETQFSFAHTTAVVAFTVQTQPPSSTPLPSTTPTPTPTPIFTSSSTSTPTASPTTSPSPSPSPTQQPTLEPTQSAKPTTPPNGTDPSYLIIGIVAAVIVAVTIVGLAVYSIKYRKKKTAN